MPSSSSHQQDDSPGRNSNGKNKNSNNNENQNNNNNDSDALNDNDSHEQSLLESIVPEGTATKRKMGWVACSFFCFISTSGGPFGIENIVKEMGPLGAIIALTAIPIFVTTPLILMIEEVSSWMTSNHGNIRWVTRALGNRLGYLNAFLQIIMNLVDCAVYPVMAQDYLYRQFAVHLLDDFWAKFGLRMAVIAIGCIPAFFPFKAMDTISAILFVVIILPFLVAFIYGLPHVEWDKVAMTSGKIDLSPLSIALFMYTGFLPKGAISGEVEKRGLLKGLCVAAVLDCFIYISPIIVSAQTETDLSKWGDGFLATAINSVFDGMGVAVGIAGFLSGLGFLTSALVCYSRTIWGVADLGWFPKIFAQTNRYDAPYYGVLLQMFFCVILNTMDFDFLIKLDFCFATIILSLFAISFVVLRFKEPDHPDRDFMVPGGNCVAVAITVPFIFIMMMTLGINLTDWRLACGLIGVLIVAFIVYLYLFKNVEDQIGKVGAGEEDPFGTRKSQAVSHRSAADDEHGDYNNNKNTRTSNNNRRNNDDDDENEEADRVSIRSSSSTRRSAIGETEQHGREYD